MGWRHAVRPLIERTANRLGMTVIPTREWVPTQLDGMRPGVLIQIVGKVETILDVGANTGQSAIQFRADYPAARIYSFEPDPRAYAELKAAMKDPLDRAINVAVTAHDGVVRFVQDADATVWSHVGEGGVETSCVTLDSWCAAEGIGQIDLLKVDTEGHDLEVMAGCVRLAREGLVSAVALEYGGFRNLQPLQNVVAAMTPMGFDIAFTFEPCVISGQLHHGNVLFVRRDLAGKLRYVYESEETAPR